MDNMNGDAPSGPLNDTGVDLTDSDQAADFLSKILDDTDLQVVANFYARAFWYGVVVLIAIVALFNLTHRVTRTCRLRAAARDGIRSARPSNLLTRWLATLTAIGREMSYPQVTPLRASYWIKVPPVGTIILLLAYLIFVLVLEFYKNNVQGAQHYTALGVRAGWLAVAQVPLLILLAGKNNLIGWVTGISYERLNVLHRWVSRMLLLLATLHMGYQNYGWNQYGLRQLEWSTDACPPTGIATYAILLWMNLSTLAPLRNLSYEFFVVQHLLTFFGFIVAIMFHLPTTALYSRVYIYIPIAVYLIDRSVRTLRLALNNARPGSASLTAFEGGVTKIRLQNRQIKTWSPGSHVLLSLPRFGIGQSHPATIVSTPSSHDGDLVFILKGRKGFTKRILRHADSSLTPLLPRTKQEASGPRQDTCTTIIDGPYGGSQADFAAFDTVLLVAGSTGITFTLAILLNLAQRAATIQRMPVRRVEFIWIVKKASWATWVSDELISAATQLKAAGVEIVIKIFVTCDDAFTDQSSPERKECGCQCDKSLGPCCCTTIPDEESKGGRDDDPDRISSLPSTTRTHKMSGVDVHKSKDDDDDDNNDTDDASGKQPPPISPSSSPSLPPPAPTLMAAKSASKSPSLTSVATYISGRPPLAALLWDLLQTAEGETGTAVCGPLGLSTTMRNAVAAVSDERAVHKGSGAQGIYLHVEGFAW